MTGTVSVLLTLAVAAAFTYMVLELLPKYPVLYKALGVCFVCLAAFLFYLASQESGDSPGGALGLGFLAQGILLSAAVGIACFVLGGKDGNKP